jgi:hypothetical protein
MRAAPYRGCCHRAPFGVAMPRAAVRRSRPARLKGRRRSAPGDRARELTRGWLKASHKTHFAPPIVRSVGF